jgi:hypothetical protein
VLVLLVAFAYLRSLLRVWCADAFARIALRATRAYGFGLG